MPLENLYLQIMAMGVGNGDARAFLSRALQPPTSDALDAASRALRRVGALTGGIDPSDVIPPPPKLDAKSEAKLNKLKDAKKSRDYGLADKLRAELKAEGIDAVMAVKSIAAAGAAAAAGDAAAPPPPAASKEELTPLGQHLARMP